MGLPPELETELGRVTTEQRMLWELWAESAEGYHALRQALAKRGFTNVPASYHDMLDHVRVANVQPSVKGGKVRTMLRRKG